MCLTGTRHLNSEEKVQLAGSYSPCISPTPIRLQGEGAPMTINSVEVDMFGPDGQVKDMW